MMAFCPKHPKWDQNPIFTPLSETTGIPIPFICGVPPPPTHPPGLERQMQTQGNTRVKWLNANHCKHKRKRRLKNGVGVVIVFWGVGCCDLEKAAFRLRLRHWIVGSLSNNNGDGYENVAWKVNSFRFKLYCDYSISFNSSNVGHFFATFKNKI